jgi:acyl-CoA dehydrogenase
LPNRFAAWALRALVFPRGRLCKPPSDRRSSEVARGLLDDRPERQALTEHIYLPPPGDEGLGRLEAMLTQVVAAQAVRAKIKDAQRSKRLAAHDRRELYDEALAKQVISPNELKLLEAADEARDHAVQVDAFEFEALLEACV